MKTDVVIVGGGPAGSCTAMFLKKLGIDSVIIEKEPFPRFHIGESMTGECGQMVRRLGLEPLMLSRNHPHKHGVKVYGQSKKGSWFIPMMARGEDGNLKDIFTWQVRRSNFDKMLLDTAVEWGATLIPGQAIKPLISDDGSVKGVLVRTKDESLMEIQSQILLDCSGQATFLANLGITGPKYLGNYDKQIAVFSHFTGFVRDQGGPTRDVQRDNTLIFYQQKFHWSWAIPLDEEVTSIGVVIPAAYFLEKKESKKDFLFRELRELHPELSRRLPEIKPVEAVHVIPNYSYQVRRFTGKGFICVGDAHRFIDPIFSFGLWVSIKESQLVAPVVKAYLSGDLMETNNPFENHQLYAEKGIDVLEDMIDSFWEKPLLFALYVHHRHREDMIDIFSGRIYDRQPSIGVNAIRKMLERDRDESYRNGDSYSIPIGSRFHPERAPLWDIKDEVESTEAWMGRR
jgi:1H-pyrrole-2-carbonyl-[peptidyl-carrier protein] brominase